MKKWLKEWKDDENHANPDKSKMIRSRKFLPIQHLFPWWVCLYALFLLLIHYRIHMVICCHFLTFWAGLLGFNYEFLNMIFFLSWSDDIFLLSLMVRSSCRFWFHKWWFSSSFHSFNHFFVSTSACRLLLIALYCYNSSTIVCSCSFISEYVVTIVCDYLSTSLLSSFLLEG